MEIIGNNFCGVSLAGNIIVDGQQQFGKWGQGWCFSNA